MQAGHNFKNTQFVKMTLLKAHSETKICIIHNIALSSVDAVTKPKDHSLFEYYVFNESNFFMLISVLWYLRIVLDL